MCVFIIYFFFNKKVTSESFKSKQTYEYDFIPAPPSMFNSEHHDRGMASTYVWWPAGLLVTLHTLYFLFIWPQCVISTFRPISELPKQIKNLINIHVTACFVFKSIQYIKLFKK